MANPYKKCRGCGKRHKPKERYTLVCYPVEFETPPMPVPVRTKRKKKSENMLDNFKPKRKRG